MARLPIVELCRLRGRSDLHGPKLLWRGDEVPRILRQAVCEPFGVSHAATQERYRTSIPGFGSLRAGYALSLDEDVMERITVGFFEGEYRRYKALGEGAFSQLDAGQLSAETLGGSSVATIVWHVSGNLESRFTAFLHSDGEKLWRDRESEFASRSVSLAEVREKWDGGWRVLLKELESLSDADLTRTVTVRDISLRVDEALLRSLAHTSYHIGQIVYIAKALKGGDWEYLSIRPGGSAAYNANPTSEKGSAHAKKLSS